MNTKRVIRLDLHLLRLILSEKVWKYSTVSFGDFGIIKQRSEVCDTANNDSKYI